MTCMFGIVLELCAAAIGAFSKQLIAYSKEVEFLQQQKAQRPSRARCLMACGQIMNMLVGPIVDGAAYAFAPQVVVAPFASFDIIFNILTAPFTLNEEVNRNTVLGTILVFIGAIVSAFAGPNHDSELSLVEFERKLFRPAGLAYIGCQFGALALLWASLRMKTGNGRKAMAIRQATMAGILMGDTYLLKGFASTLRTTIQTGAWFAFITSPVPVLCLLVYICTSLLGNCFMSQALPTHQPSPDATASVSTNDGFEELLQPDIEAPAVIIIPIFEGTHILCCCLSGCVVLAELDGADMWRAIVYWCGVLFLLAGLIVVQIEPDSPPDPHRRSFAQGQVRRASVCAQGSTSVLQAARRISTSRGSIVAPAMF